MKLQTFNTNNSEDFEKDLINFILEKYDLYRQQQNQDIIQNAEKWLMLETIDQAWKQHMLNLDHLKEGIGLRSCGQKNPLIEYKREAFAMFQEMMQDIQRILCIIFSILILERFDQHELEKKRERELDQINLLAGHDIR